jgi:hypothetical protein
MTNKLKVLGLTLVAAIAFGVLATAASAEEFHSGSGSGTTFLTGTQIGTNQLDTEGGNIKCTTVSYVGSYAGTTAGEVQVTPTYSGCTAYGLTAHINFNGCKIKKKAKIFRILEIICFVEQAITIIPTQGGVGVCTISVPPQEIGVNYTNEAGSPDDVVVTPNSSTIKYAVSYPGGSGSKCGAAGEHSDGKYTGSVTEKAYSDSGHTTQVNLTVL